MNELPLSLRLANFLFTLSSLVRDYAITAMTIWLVVKLFTLYPLGG